MTKAKTTQVEDLAEGFREIAPAADRRVRHEDGRLLDEAGETVAWSTHWQRRLNDEDIIQLRPVAAEQEA